MTLLSTVTEIAAVLENMKQTQQRLLDGYNEWDLDAIMAPRAETCTHQILPLNAGGQPMNNSEYCNIFGARMKYFSNFVVTLEVESFDVDSKMSTARASSTADTPVGPYTNEYAFFIWFSEDGKEVTRIQEICDSAFTISFFAKLQKYLQTSA